jgi:hypothetical protein
MNLEQQSPPNKEDPEDPNKEIQELIGSKADQLITEMEGVNKDREILLQETWDKVTKVEEIYKSSRLISRRIDKLEMELIAETDPAERKIITSQIEALEPTREKVVNTLDELKEMIENIKVMQANLNQQDDELKQRIEVLSSLLKDNK